MILALAAAAALAAPAPWTAQDTVLECILAGLSVLDAAETSFAVRAYPEAREINPLLGPRPSDTRIWAATAAGLAVHLAVARLLSGRWRAAWQLLPITYQVVNVVYMGANISGRLPW